MLSTFIAIFVKTHKSKGGTEDREKRGEGGEGRKTANGKKNMKYFQIKAKNKRERVED